MTNIINIVNFVRGVEPREGRNIDLRQPVAEQLKIMKNNGLTGTFLFQYDALISPDFRDLMNECAEFCEVGLWLEIVEPLVRAVGEQWRGRYPWDWYCDVGFLIGYEPDVRKKLIDECMRAYREIFGKYPRSVGAWHIDAVSMGYLHERYGTVACCICRDQVGTDGYTLQGGYYNQAYYPCKKNMFCPASTREEQIDMPVFRMLGSDPVYAYDQQLFKYGMKRISTLEAAQMGRDSRWCDWFFDAMFSGRGLCFQYAQAGQENSFGWRLMGEGIEYQFPKIAQMAREGKVKVMTLGDSGEWYKERYEMTPPATVAVDSAFDNADIRSVWYCSKYYRTNIIVDKGVARIRDMYVFDEDYAEHYLSAPCDTHACEFRNLPVMDGAIYSNAECSLVAGVYMTVSGEPIVWSDIRYSEETPDRAVTELICERGYARLVMTEKEIVLYTDIDGFKLCPVYDRDRVYGTNDFGSEQFANHNNRKTCLNFVTRAVARDGRIELCFDGHEYGIQVAEGHVDEQFCLTPRGGAIRVKV